MNRFPRSVYGVGNEPDPRFSLANERTFLAWCRTSFAIVSLAIALDNISVAMIHDVKRFVVMLALVIGSVLPVLAWIDWVRVEKAMRLGHALPKSVTQFVFAIATTVCAGCVTIGVFATWSWL